MFWRLWVSPDKVKKILRKVYFLRGGKEKELFSFIDSSGIFKEELIQLSSTRRKEIFPCVAFFETTGGWCKSCPGENFSSVSKLSDSIYFVFIMLNWMWRELCRIYFDYTMGVTVNYYHSNCGKKLTLSTLIAVISVNMTMEMVAGSVFLDDVGKSRKTTMSKVASLMDLQGSVEVTKCLRISSMDSGPPRKPRAATVDT